MSRESRILSFMLNAALLMPATGMAEERRPLNQASRQVSVASNPAGFDEWQERLNRAETSRRNARNTILIGIGISASSVLLSALAARTGLDEVGNLKDSGRSALAIGLIGGLGGSAVIGLGGWKYVSARDEIEDLDREGRTKGFLSAAPVPGKSALVALHLTF